MVGYSLDTASSNTVGPNVGGNSTVTVGGNPNIQSAIVSAASIFQNPLTLLLIGAVVLGGIWIWKGGR